MGELHLQRSAEIWNSVFHLSVQMEVRWKRRVPPFSTSRTLRFLVETQHLRELASEIHERDSWEAAKPACKRARVSQQQLPTWLVAERLLNTARGTWAQ